MDNRPLRFDEWEGRCKQVLFMSATPGDYELNRTGGEFVEQIIRPTGLIDPEIEVRPALGQVQDLAKEIQIRAGAGERILCTTLTKRMAEDLTNFFKESGIRCKWLHSELDAIERIQIIRELREGAFDALVGVNLLREGLDLPEVSLVAILDADKEGFLRSGTSLIQTIGRAARNVNSKVFLYADRVTDSMNKAIGETNRRREIQIAYNKKYSITPKSVRSTIESGIEQEIAAQKMTSEVAGLPVDENELQQLREKLQEEMLEAAAKLDFEKAAKFRDELAKLRGDAVATPQGRPKRKGRSKRE